MGDRGRRVEVFKPGLGYITILRPAGQHGILRRIQETERKEGKEWEMQSGRKEK